MRALNDLACKHFAYDEKVRQGLLSDRLYRLDLKAAARQALGQFRRRDVGYVDIFVKPA